MRTFVRGLLALTLAGGAYGQTQEPHGIDRATLESGELPAGWFALDTGQLALGAELEARPVEPCAFVNDRLDATWANAAWPGGVVPYEFNSNTTIDMQNQALAAMNALESFDSTVNFVPRSGETAFMMIRDHTSNAVVGAGYNGGQKTLNILSWNSLGTIMHELLHVLGFYHEQSRADRDFYVQIITSNIQSGRESNFDIEGSAYYTGPYDFGSIMHYGECHLSVCSTCAPGCETILTRPGYEAFQAAMGQRIGLSPLDRHGLNSLYPQSWWRFVAWNPGAGSGTGLDPWQELSSALTSAPSGARVFVMPGTYAAPATGTTAMTLEAPVGGVLMQ